MRIIGAFILMGALALVWFVTLGQPEGAKVARVQTDDVAISNAIGTYAINAGRPPSTEQGLKALAEKPATGPEPRRWTQIWKKAPTDPWGRPYGYRIVAEGERKWRYELRSAGVDGAMYTGDDHAWEFSFGDWER